MKSLIMFIVIIPAMCFSGSYPIEVKIFIEGSLEGLTLQTDAHNKTWGLGTEKTWNVEQDKGIIFWSFDDGMYGVAQVQIIGTYNPKDGSFLWAWDHPSVDKSLQLHSALVKDYGLKHGVAMFTTRKVYVSEDQAWEFTAVANRLAEANGGYRGDSGGPLVFMTFGAVKLSKGKPQ